MDSISEQFPFSLALLEGVREPVLLLDERLRVLAVNQAYLSYFDCDRDRLTDQFVLDVPPGLWDEGDFREALERLLRSDDGDLIDLVMEPNAEVAGSSPLQLRIRRINSLDPDSRQCLIFVSMDDAARQDMDSAGQARVAALFHKAGVLAHRSNNPRDILRGCLEVVCEVTRWPVGHLWLPDPEDLDRLASTDDWHACPPPDEAHTMVETLRADCAGMGFHRGQGLPGQIWESGEPAWIVDLQDTRVSVRKDLAARAGVRGAFGFPVKIKGETIAVLEFFSERPMDPDRPLLALMRSLGELVGLSIEHARIETALRHNKQEFGELFEHSTVGILFLSPHGVIQRANSRLLEKLGYAAHDFVGHSFREFLIDKASADSFEQCCGIDEQREFETRLRARDGSTRHVLLTMNAHRIEPDVAYIRCFIRDITERKQDESELARLAAIVHSSDDAIIGLSPDGLITSWNRGAERLYGHAADDVRGGTISLIVPAEREEEMTQLLETVKRGQRVEQFETVRVHHDGRRIHVSMTLSPIHAAPTQDPTATDTGATGVSPVPNAIGPSPLNPKPVPRNLNPETPVIGVAMIERDISERKRVAAEIRRAVQEAERANRAKGEFLANVSHELRTPMNAIIGMTELALDEKIPDRVRDYLDTANDSAEMLLRLLNDILDFSRIEAGRFEIDEANFSLRETLEETIKALAVRAHEKGLEIGLHVLPDVPDRLVGDPVRLRQVVTNLVGNAIKFTEAGEVVISIENQLVRDLDASLHFQIRDTGIGISEHDQERIFAPFAQVDATSTRNHGGAGLGLAICRELVAMMHGRMWIDSQPNHGTTFHFLARFGIAAPPEHAAPPSGVVRELKGLPVLIVDDNATNRQILGESLENWHMLPVLAESAEQALRELQLAEEENRLFPLIFVDGLMPGTDGFTLVEQIRADAKFSGATVLMLSSSERRFFRDRCDRLDVSGYLEKPITQSELLDTIVTTLQGPPLEQDAAEQAGRIGGADQPLSILLVEDTPANRKVVTAVLNKRGHSVTIATDGREAVEVYKQQRGFDLILMDVQMPNMDGYQATGIIRTIGETEDRRTPIIAMTAHAMRGDRERCLAAGMDAYLSKPIDVRRMLRLVERVAARARRHSPPRQSPVRTNGREQTGRQPSADAAHATAARGATAGPRHEPTQPPTHGGVMHDRHESRESLFDKASALERLGGDEQLFQELTQYFLEDSDTLLNTIVASAQLEDWAAVRIAAHSLKGLAANFSARPATEACRMLEDAAAAGDGPRVKTLIDPTIQEIERLKVALAKQ